MHPNLSAKLNAIVQEGNNSPSIDIKAQKKGTMFDVIVDHIKYTIVVVDPNGQEVALTTNDPNIQEIDIWHLMGAGWGGSTIKIGYIVVGAQMRMRRLSGGLIETSPVKSFSFRDEPEEAKRILDKAESRRPQMATKAEIQEYEAKFKKAIEQLIAKEFSSEEQEWVWAVVNCFGNIPAKGTVRTHR